MTADTLTPFFDERGQENEFRPYTTVAICYDGGQTAADAAIHRAFDETLSANTADYKLAK